MPVPLPPTRTNAKLVSVRNSMATSPAGLRSEGFHPSDTAPTTAGGLVAICVFGLLTSSLVHSPMINEFTLDLKVARKRSGLTQIDCAHLLSIHPSLISQTENGKRMPTIREICTLSLVYGRSFESLFAGIFADARGDLQERLATMPEAPKHWLGRHNRQHTLGRLADRLHDTDGYER